MDTADPGGSTAGTLWTVYSICCSDTANITRNEEGVASARPANPAASPLEGEPEVKRRRTIRGRRAGEARAYLSRK
jgi:hypothetical protein